MVQTHELLRFIYKVKEGDVLLEELSQEADSLLRAAGYIDEDTQPE